MITIQPGIAQHIGKRKEQQDAFGFTDLEDRSFLKHGGALAVVADGMGGLSFGDHASRLAVSAFLHEYMAKNREEMLIDALRRSLLSANQAVYEMACEKDMINETGTTLVAAVVNRNTLYWISVGDSRLYLFRKGKMTLLTRDHNYARELSREVRKGLISREEADAHPERKALTSYLGLENVPEIDHNLHPFPMEPGDRLILCSDGFYGSLTEAEMVSSLSQNSPQKCSEELLKRVIAKQIPHQDNVTVAMLSLENKDHSNNTTGRSILVGRWKFLCLSILIFFIICIGGFFCISHLKRQDPQAAASPKDQMENPIEKSTSSADKESLGTASGFQEDKKTLKPPSTEHPSEPVETKPETSDGHPTTPPSSADTSSAIKNEPTEDVPGQVEAGKKDDRIDSDTH
nr:protein phosphatase 2C domain-containing protein [uncultured Desulfobacter sp.]